MKARITATLIALLGTFLITATMANPVPQTQCPATGNPISKDAYTDYNGKRIYYCCQGCDKKFLADPAGTIKKLEASGVTLAEAPIVQKNCLISGDEIEKDVFIDHQGTRVYFCCKMCIGTFNKAPQKYLDILSAEKKKATEAAAAAVNKAAEGSHKKMEGSHKR